MNIPSWDEYFMRHVYLAATKSHDPRTKIGAVLVKNGVIISEGYNNFPRKVLDLPERYNDRELKHRLVCHGEANAILNCARNGVGTLDSILYTQGIPCEHCAKILIQGGTKEVVIHKQWPEMGELWRESVGYSRLMFKEANISISAFDGILGLKGMCDGKEIEV